MDLKFHSDSNNKAILIVSVENNLVKYLSVASSETEKTRLFRSHSSLRHFSGLLPLVFVLNSLYENKNFIAS